MTRIEIIITGCIYKCDCAHAPKNLCTIFLWFDTINLGGFIVYIEGSQGLMSCGIVLYLFF